MDAVDRLAAAGSSQTEALLVRGQLLVWDNRRFLHGRRSFRDVIGRRRLRRMYGMHNDPAPAR
jgi:alpha-ketoglutarate-dependent taurine dioxygenase